MKRFALCAALMAAMAAPSNGMITNGDFSDTPVTFFTTVIPGWSVITTEVPFTDQAGIFFVFDGVLAQGSAMVLLSTGPTNRDTATILISDSFVVDDNYIRFDYRYVAGHTLEEALAGRDDPFTVSIINLSTTGANFTKRVFDGDGSDSQIGFEESFTNFGPLPSSSIDRIMTDWGFATIDMRAFLGDTVQIVFTINDSGGGSANSGVFIDNVRLTPEPAAIALFGLGIAGLGLAIRRRKNKSLSA